MIDKNYFFFAFRREGAKKGTDINYKNEDYYHLAEKNNHIVLFISDGHGGKDETVPKICAELLIKNLELSTNENNEEKIKESIINAFKKTNKELETTEDKELRQLVNYSGATFTLVLITSGGKVFTGGIGDSPVYSSLEPSKQITINHDLFNEDELDYLKKKEDEIKTKTGIDYNFFVGSVDGKKDRFFNYEASALGEFSTFLTNHLKVTRAFGNFSFNRIVKIIRDTPQFADVYSVSDIDLLFITTDGHDDAFRNNFDRTPLEALLSFLKKKKEQKQEENEPSIINNKEFKEFFKENSITPLVEQFESKEKFSKINKEKKKILQAIQEFIICSNNNNNDDNSFILFVHLGNKSWGEWLEEATKQAEKKSEWFNDPKQRKFQLIDKKYTNENRNYNNKIVTPTGADLNLVIPDW